MATRILPDHCDEVQPLPVAAAPTVAKRTYCKICMASCGLVAEVAGDRTIVSVKADRDHPLTRGYSCPKGRATGQLYHIDRPITHPMLRRGGELVAVGWDEALDDVAARLRRIVEAHGPQAIGMYFGSGMGLDSSGYQLQDALHRALGSGPKFSPLTNDGTAKSTIAGVMARSFAINPKVDYDAAKLVVYVGTNPLVSHAHNTGMFNPGSWLKAINRRGGEIWVIDPLRTETANYAAGHIAARPGSDYVILAWLAREIIAGGPLAPRQPVRHLAELTELLGDLDRSTAAAIAGVPERQLDELLAAVRRHGIVAIETGTGVTMSATANLTVWLAWVVMILTGSMNVPGGTWMHPGALYALDQLELPLLDDAFTPGSPTRPDVKGIMGEWPCGVLPAEIAAGNIRGFFNFGGHILRSFPDAHALAAALPQLDLLVGTEIAHNELCRFATHLLPTKATVERPEFSRWDTLAWNVQLQYSPALVRPMGERRSGWWVISQIMRRAGLPVPDHVPDEPSDAADEAMLAAQLAFARCSFAELKERRYVEFPRELPSPWVDRHIARAGGWELMPPAVVEQWHRFLAADRAALGRPRPPVLLPRRQRRKLNGQLGFLGEAPTLLIHPDTAAAHGVGDGDAVRVSTRSGEIVVPAKLDAAVLPGTCSIPHGHYAANVNLLTSADDIDPLGGMAHYSGVPVTLAPAQIMESETQPM